MSTQTFRDKNTGKEWTFYEPLSPEDAIKFMMLVSKMGEIKQRKWRKDPQEEQVSMQLGALSVDILSKALHITMQDLVDMGHEEVGSLAIQLVEATLKGT